MGLQHGWRAGDQELAIITGQIRRRIPTVVTKANINCLIKHMQLVGPGNSELGQKREYTQQVESAAGKESCVAAESVRNTLTHTIKGFIKTV